MLCSMLLLAATCSLLTAGVSSTSITTCDDGASVQRLNCDGGVIHIQAVLYGRTNRHTCSEGRPPQELSDTQCTQRGTLDVLQSRCEGKRWCELNTDVVRTSDPCYGTFKYLQTNFTCYPAIQVVVCEHSSTLMYCAEGQVISVYGAYYGRSDHTTCSYRRPADQIQNVYCSHPATSLAQRCNGQNSCTITASNSQFGDPCFGTYKYLQVSYVCQYPN